MRVDQLDQNAQRQHVIGQNPIKIQIQITISYLPNLVGAGAAVGVGVRVGSGLGLVRNCSAIPALVRFFRIHQAALVDDGIVIGGYERE